MQRPTNVRSLINNTDIYDKYQNTFKKNNKYSEIQFDEIPLKKSVKNIEEQYETLDEVDILVNKYSILVKEIKSIRGRLYSLGIDPEKYLNI